MSDCDHMAWGSRIRQICEGTSELPLKKVNWYREQNGLPPIVREGSPNTVAAETTGGVRVRMLPVTTPPNPRGCCGGPVKQKKVTHAPPRRKSVFDRVAAYATAVAKHLADDNAAASISDLMFRRSKCEGCPFNVNRKCVLCDCPLDKNLINNGKLSWRSESCPTGRWHRHNATQRRLESPVRNMLFHIYPRLGAEWNWHWHIEQIAQHAKLFNGKIVIGIVTDSGTATAEEVQRLLTNVPVTDWIIKPNKVGTAETETFVEMLSLVKSDDPREISFRGHTKGVTHQRSGIEQPWARLAWQTCMDIESVEDALQSHVMAGPLKCHEPLVRKKADAWFYAGTFFWFRSDVFQRDWSSFEKTRWWPEYWPGQVCENGEAACLCHDFAVSSVLSAKYWSDEVEPDWQRWRQARGITE